MKKILQNIVILLFLSMVIAACKKPVEDKKDEELEETVPLTQFQIDSLHFVYIAINDSLDASWTVMIQDDDEKIADMKRLLQEVTKTQRYNKTKLDTLLREVEQLSLIRYDRSSMADSDKIDDYDSATSVVTKEVIMFAAEHPQYKSFPQLEAIINDIQAADNRVILHRIRYDRSAKDYNNFMQQNEKYIPQIDSTKYNWKKAALFELGS